jgi:hypothetical protein
MLKKLKIIVGIIAIILIAFVIKSYFFSSLISWDGKYHLNNIFACLDNCQVQTWPIADDIVINKKSPISCEKILVYDPRGYSTTESAIDSCYFEVAERLRDKSVCKNLEKYSNDRVTVCQNNIDTQNTRDLIGFQRLVNADNNNPGVSEADRNVLHIPILKEDAGKDLRQLIKNAIAPHLYITDMQKKYGYDFQISLPATIKMSVTYPVQIKFTPQNVSVNWKIVVDNPYNIGLK